MNTEQKIEAIARVLAAANGMSEDDWAITVCTARKCLRAIGEDIPAVK